MVKDAKDMDNDKKPWWMSKREKGLERLLSTNNKNIETKKPSKEKSFSDVLESVYY